MTPLRRRLAAGLAGAAALLAALPPAAAGFDEGRLAARIGAIAAAAAPARLGVALVDLDDGALWSWRGGEPFPMQSVYKLPIALAAFDGVDRGALRLDQEVAIGRAELSIAWSPIARAFTGGPRTYTLLQLLEHALQLSDNTASDVLLQLVGGPAAVTALLRRHGIEGMRVDRPERELQTDARGLPPFRPEWSQGPALAAAVAALPQARRREALRAYLADPRDTATPEATARLLARLGRGELLSAASTAALLGILDGTRTGAERLKAGVPPGARVAHKTGTAADVLGIGPAVNDVGIVTLPGGRRIAVAVYLSGSDRPPAERERSLAEVARAAVEALRPPAAP